MNPSQYLSPRLMHVGKEASGSNQGRGAYSCVLLLADELVLDEAIRKLKVTRAIHANPLKTLNLVASLFS